MENQTTGTTKIFAIYDTNAALLQYAGPAASYSDAVRACAAVVRLGDTTIEACAAECQGIEISRQEYAVIEDLKFDQPRFITDYVPVESKVGSV